MYAPNNTLKIHEAKRWNWQAKPTVPGGDGGSSLPVIGRTGRWKTSEDILGRTTLSPDEV